MSEYPPIDRLLPHGDAIRELDRLVDWAPGRAECTMQVSPSSRLVTDGRLESVLLLEPMAQAVAACLGYEAYRAGEGVRVGMVVACRRLETRVASLAVGSMLRIRVTRSRGSEATSQFDCEVVFDGVDGASIAKASLTLVHGGVRGDAPRACAVP